MNRTAEALASDIVLRRSPPQHRDKAILLVEGRDDWDFFKRFVDTKTCIIEIGGDKMRVVRAIQILDKQARAGILAVVDADFDIINGVRSYSINLLLTDCHDIEGMIASSESLQDFVATLIPRDDQRLDHGLEIAVKVRMVVLKIAKTIGFLRLLSERNNGALSIKDFQVYIDTYTFEVDMDHLISDAWLKAKRNKYQAKKSGKYVPNWKS